MEWKSRDQPQAQIRLRCPHFLGSWLSRLSPITTGLEKVAPQVKVGLNPNVGLAQGHEGCHMQDPRRSQVMQLQAVGL
jgi:hypothetical protein